MVKGNIDQIKIHFLSAPSVKSKNKYNKYKMAGWKGNTAHCVLLKHLSQPCYLATNFGRSFLRLEHQTQLATQLFAKAPNLPPNLHDARYRISLFYAKATSSADGNCRKPGMKPAKLTLMMTLCCTNWLLAKNHIRHWVSSNGVRTIHYITLYYSITELVVIGWCL